MTRYIFRRLLQAIPTLIGVSILSFILVNAAPGDPVTMRTFGDTRMTEEARQILRRQLGLDQHPIVQYFVWMTGLSVQRGDQVAVMTRPGKPCGYVGGIGVTVCDGGGGILRGDLGVSLDTKQPVWDRIVERMAATLELGIVSLALSLLIGVPLGVLSAVKHGSLFDNLVRFFAVVFRAVPIFWMGLLLIFVFSVMLGWLPTGGRQTVSLTQTFNLGDRLRHLILPASVLAFGGIAGFSRIMRTETLEVLHTDYIRTAQAKGLSPGNVWFVHAFRNALIPLMTVMGPAVVGVLGGAVVVETIFAWPGMGRLTVNAAFQQDYPVVLGAGMFFAVLTIIGYTLSDIFYAVVDPRVRFD
ncbi:MAG: ABC transporter permease [Caldilineaceae bacterium]|nr:ABC transporter permease [Caldilineaceae bacterium]